VEMVRTMMRLKYVGHDLCADSFKTAVYNKKRVTSQALLIAETPFELWNGNKPDVGPMRVAGCTKWVALHKSHIEGMSGDNAAKSVFLGYPDCRKG